MNTARKEVVIAMAKAREGVVYTPKHGAVCPCCGAERLPVTRTMPWSGAVRIRYHRCTNAECLICAIGEGIKSLQEE